MCPVRSEPAVRFLDARAWRARVLLVVGLLLLVQGARVVALELLWGRTEPCLVDSVHTGGDPGAYVVRLDVTLEHPTCVMGVDATPPLPTREAAEARSVAWRENGTTTCHRVPLLCGASIARPHVAAPFWCFPLAAAGCLALGIARRRAPRSRAAPGGGPFRAPAEVVEPEGTTLAVRLPGSGWIAKAVALLFPLAPGVLGAPPMIVIFLLDPLNTVAFPLLCLVMASISSAMLLSGLYLWFGRRRLVVDGTGRAAYRSAGIGGLDFRRTYARFATAPEVTVRPREGTGRFGGKFVVGWDVALSDGETTLVTTLDTEADARKLAERVRAHVGPRGQVHPGAS
jgi:hypothetical protein